MEIAAPALEERSSCLMIERIQLMSVIAVVPEETAAAAGAGSERVEVEVGEVARLVQGNLPAECWTKEVEVALSLPSSRKVLPFRSFLQYFDQIVVEVVAIEMAMAVEVVEMKLALVVACLQE